jgi:hypothetical protein
VLEASGEEALVRAHRFVEIRDGDADVVDSSCFHASDATAAGSRCAAWGTVVASG